MGGRKFRLSAHRKNNERKLSLPISIPLAKLQHVPVKQQVVSLPLTAFTTSSVTDLTALEKRVSESKLLPSGWTANLQTLSSSNATSSALTICRLQFPDVPTRVNVSFVLTIYEDFRWSVRFYGHTLETSTCVFLSSLPTALCSANLVHVVLTALDSATVCVGNPDQRFMQLATHHKGEFHDPAGKNCF